MDELVGDLRGDVRPVVADDQRQHHVGRRRAAGAGEAVAVDLEQVGPDLEPVMLGGEARLVLPVDRRPVAVEEAGLGQHVGAGTDRTIAPPRMQVRRSRVCKAR